MAVVRLGPNGEVEVIVPPTPEEEARGREKILDVARALGRLAAARDFEEQREAALCKATEKRVKAHPVLGSTTILTRQDVARQQLEAAIRDLFLSHDLVAAHLLGWAALDVIADVAKTHSRPTLRGAAEALMDPHFRKVWRRAERDHYNFLKHADRDPQRKARLLPAMTTFALYIACRDYLAAFDESTPVLAVFTGWYLSQNPDMRQAFKGAWDDVLRESFDADPETAWSQAATMVDVALKHREAFSASFARKGNTA